MSMYDRKRKYESEQNKYYKRNKSDNALIKRIQAQNGIRGKLVFIYSEKNLNPWSVLQAAAVSEKVELAVVTIPQENKLPIFELKLDDEMIVRGEFTNITTAKKELSRLALKNLQYSCFSIIKKQSPEDIEKVNVTSEAFEEKKNSEKGKFDKNSEALQNSVGARMMKLMGWTGGGLGSREQGNENLVNLEGQVDRRGLGQKSPSEIKELLEEYSKNEEIDSLAFPGNFTKEQRAFVHSVASQLNLKSKSYGKEGNRIIVIRKKLKPWQMVHQLLECGGETVEYKLILPLNEVDNENDSASASNT